MKSTIKKILSDACVYYTVGTLLLYLFIAILDSTKIPSILNVILIFPFCVSLAGARLLTHRELFSPTGRRLLHFGILELAFFLFLWLPSGVQKTFPSALITLFWVAVIYWLAFLTVRLTVHRYRSFKEE